MIGIRLQLWKARCLRLGCWEEKEGKVQHEEIIKERKKIYEDDLTEILLHFQVGLIRQI